MYCTWTQPGIVLPPDPTLPQYYYATGTYLLGRYSGFRSQVPRLTSIGLDFFNLTPSRSLARWLLMPPTALFCSCLVFSAPLLLRRDNHRLER